MAELEGADYWPVEVIPENQTLFMRVHSSYFGKSRDIPKGAFCDKGAAMSTDWAKYSTAAETRLRAKEPMENGVVAIDCDEVRKIEGLAVVHAPDVERRVRGHTNVVGDKKATPEVRVKLQRASVWAIRLGENTGIPA